MSLTGDIAMLGVSLVQQGGVILAVGAITITLIGHLLALHAKQDETMLAYVRAAVQARALALVLIILSGIAAVVVHVQTGTPGTIVAPAFIFKWALIGVLTAFYFLELDARGWWRDAVEGFEGANWYALFIVHTMAPIVGWGILIGVYLGWLAAFGVIWAGFVWFMRWQAATGAAPAAPKQLPVQTPAPQAAAPKPEPKPVQPKPADAPMHPTAPKPAAPIAAKPVEKKIEVHPNHSLLPMVAELDLPAPKKADVPAPVAAVAQPKPAPMPEPKPVPPPAPAPLPQEEPKKEIAMPDLDEKGLPGLRVMPKRPEDIDGSSRPPIVKLEADEGPRAEPGTQ